MARKQYEVAHFISHHKISMFGLLETKVKHHNLGQLYQRVCPGWCFTHNLAWSNSCRIIVVWQHDKVTFNVILNSS